MRNPSPLEDILSKKLSSMGAEKIASLGKLDSNMLED
jgi:hypothetical protein